MPAPVVLILAAGRGERFLASGGNTHKCIGWRQSPEVAPYRWPFVTGSFKPSGLFPPALQK